MEEDDEHYFTYGDVAQFWKRKIRSTGQLVSIPDIFSLAFVAKNCVKVAVKGFRMTTTCGVDNINSEFEAVRLAKSLANVFKTTDLFIVSP